MSIFLPRRLRRKKVYHNDSSQRHKCKSETVLTSDSDDDNDVCCCDRQPINGPEIKLGDFRMSSDLELLCVFL